MTDVVTVYTKRPLPGIPESDQGRSGQWYVSDMELPLEFIREVAVYLDDPRGTFSGDELVAVFDPPDDFDLCTCRLLTEVIGPGLVWVQTHGPKLHFMRNHADYCQPSRRVSVAAKHGFCAIDLDSFWGPVSALDNYNANDNELPF